MTPDDTSLTDTSLQGGDQALTTDASNEEVNPEAVPEKEETDESKRLRGVERRINRLASERAAARAEAAFYRQQFEAGKAANKADGEDAVPLTRAQMEQEFESWEAQRQESAKRDQVANKVLAAKASDKDFASALDSLDVEFQPAQLAVFADAISDGDDGIVLLKYLAKHPDVVEDLADLSPIKLARELARLEIKAAASAKPKVSNADTPIVPVKGSASLSSLGDPDKIGTAEWIKRRNAQLAKK